MGNPEPRKTTIQLACNNRAEQDWHPAFRSLDAGLAFAILASLGQHTPARLAPAHPSRTRSSGARRISALARAAPALPYRYASAVSAGAGPYLSGAIVKLARPWLTLRTAAE
jgi:hypothetical protein